MRVELRRPERADARQLAALLRADREWLRPFDPIRPEAFFTEPGQRGRIDHVRDEEALGRGLGRVVVLDGDVVGWLGISNVVRGVFGSANLGYWVARPVNGRGVATAAVGLAVEEAFGPLGLRRLEAGTLLGNVASQTVLRRNAFLPFGVARDYLVIGGSPSDHLLFQRIAPGAGAPPAPRRDVPAGVALADQGPYEVGATADGVDVGSALLVRQEPVVARLVLHVAPAARGRGIGSALLARVLAAGDADPTLLRVEIELPAADPGVGFLLRRGFAAEGLRRSASLRGGEPVDHVVLARVRA